jgi:membrane-associated protein
MDILDLFLHIDKHLAAAINIFGPWIYILLGCIVFVETGLVIMPFLPGDSLLFAAGALAGAGFLKVGWSYGVLFAAAVLGDTINYWVGRAMGPKVFARENSRLFKKEYLERTNAFYKKHGGKTIVIARFMPIVRTFAPFVAGVGKMRYATFAWYNFTGGFVWVTALFFVGYFFGGLPFIEKNFEYVILGIVMLSLVPMAIEYGRYRRGPKVSKDALREGG